MREYKPLSDTRLYDKFNCKIIDHSFDFRSLIEDLLGYTDLENLHEQIGPLETNKLFKLFEDLDNTIIDEYIDSIVDNEEYLVQRTPNFRIVLPDHDKHGQVLFFHQGIWVGNGYGMRTIWTPITDVYGSNSFQIANLDDSLKFTKDTYEQNWTYNIIQEEANKICKPATLNYGQALLFTQEHIHGQIPNRTSKTRISFETRILLKGGDFNQKTPGGYFKKPFSKEHNKKGNYKNAIVIPTFDGPMFADCTQFAQTILMEDYIKKNDVEINFKCTDLSTTNCAYAKYLAKNNIYENMIFPSIWAFQVEDLKEILNADVTVHFAGEELCCDTKENKSLALYYRNFS
mgnify:CR=1 FL=1|jgi:hypothetical protein